MSNLDDINGVLAAIDALYDETPSEPAVRKERMQKASEWLGELQKSVSVVEVIYSYDALVSLFNFFLDYPVLRNTENYQKSPKTN